MEKGNNKMSGRDLIYLTLAWCLFRIIEYYFFPYFIVSLLWIVLSVALGIIAIVLIFGIIRRWKTATNLAIAKALTFVLLFYFTYNHWIVSRLIERADWRIFYIERMEVVKQVKQGKLSSNENGVSKLPFEFPFLSHDGNEISVYRNDDNGTVTVSFWIYRNFFSAPSTSFVYTNDLSHAIELDELVKNDPQHNWKINSNWYRTCKE